MLEAPGFISLQRKIHTVNSLRRSPLPRRLVKAAFDYTIVIPALISLAPLMLIIAILIKLESPGPILHRRRVLGRMGHEFNAYKFRTVYVNSGERLVQNREQWVSLLRNKRPASDPRVTRVGVYLRRCGLDQLPSLLNILARHMSLVGPYVVTKKDTLRIDRQRIDMITSVLPGLTGIWQVKAQNASVNERARLELDYIRNWSLRLDMAILFSTFAAIWQEEKR